MYIFSLIAKVRRLLQQGTAPFVLVETKTILEINCPVLVYRTTYHIVNKKTSATVRVCKCMETAQAALSYLNSSWAHLNKQA